MDILFHPLHFNYILRGIFVKESFFFFFTYFWILKKMLVLQISFEFFSFKGLSLRNIYSYINITLIMYIYFSKYELVFNVKYTICIV